MLLRYCGKSRSSRFTFVGMAGNQVLEWTDLDTEIKTAGLKDVNENRDLSNFFRSLIILYRTLLLPQTCMTSTFYGRSLGSSIMTFHRLVQGDMRHNWRTGMWIYGVASEPELSGSAAYSIPDESVPIAYFSEQPQCM